MKNSARRMRRKQRREETKKRQETDPKKQRPSSWRVVDKNKIVHRVRVHYPFGRRSKGVGEVIR